MMDPRQTSILAESASSNRGFRIAARGVAMTAIVLGGLGIAGHGFHVEMLQSSVRPLTLYTVGGSLISLLVGLSLWLSLGSSRKAGLVTAAAAVVVASSVLLARAWWATFSDPRPSVAGAVLLGAAGAGLMAVNLPLGKQAQQIVWGVIGVAISSLALTLIAVQSASIFDRITDSHISNISLQSLVIGGMVGTLFLSGVWISALPASGDGPLWLPMSIGLTATIIVLFLWRAFVERERNHLLAQTQVAANVGRHYLRRSIEANSSTMLRVAGWLASGADRKEVASALRRILNDFPGLTAAAWLTPDGETIAVPEANNTLALANRLSADKAKLLTPGNDLIIPLDDNHRTIAIVAPVCPRNVCSSRVIGILDVEQLFNHVLGDSTPGFNYRLAGISPPYSDKFAGEFQNQMGLALGDAHWVVVARPTHIVMSSVRSDLPTATLFFGLLVAGLLAITVRLGQVNRFNASQVARARLSAALDRATDGVWELDLTSGAATRSRTLWNYLQYGTPPEGPDRWFDLVHPDDRLTVDQELERHLKGQSDRFEVQYRIRAGDGSWHQIIDRGRVVDRSSTGRPLRILGICADVTEGLAAATARDESQRRFRAAFDGAFNYQMVLSVNGSIIEANQAISSHFEESDPVRGIPCWTTLWWRDHPQAADRLKVAIDGAQRGEVRRYTEDFSQGGGGPVLELVVAPIAGHDQQFSELLLEARDDTARRRAEAALQEVSTLTIMGRIAARVAHEINNPLAGIQNAFLLLKDAISPDHPHHLYVAAIEREIARIASVTRQLYETYRPDIESTSESSVATIVADAAALLSQLNKGAGVKIETQFLDVPAVIPLPSALVRQVVFNLVQNAVEASRPGGVVSVKTNLSDGSLRILVRDRGPGIPAELKTKVFEPFFATKREESTIGGTGIGLWLVRRSVTAVGGQITADNADGGGAEFTVEIPIHPSGSRSVS